MSFWNASVATGEPLTEESLMAAIDAIAAQPYEPHPCKLGHHMTSATALRECRERTRDGFRCVECLCWIDTRSMV